jgi:uncharacterized protein
VGALRRLARLALGCAPCMFAGALVLGCSHQERMRPVVERYERGEYARAAEEIVPLLEDRRESEKDRTLYELEAGSVFAAAGDLARSIEAFAAADERMWPYLDESPEMRISEEAAAILTNQTIITYRGRTYDRIMCCTYQALNHLATGDLDAAGVMLRRAYEWQRDATERNAAEIEALERKAGEAAREKGYDTNAAMSDGRVKSGLDSAYGPLREMRGYAEFAVPYSTYLQALQLQLTGRADALAQATVAFRRTAGMLSEDDRLYAELDAQLAEAATAGAQLAPSVHVLVESGSGPWLDEFRLDIPLFIRQVPYVGIALPVLKFKEGAAGSFTVRAGGEVHPSRVLTDMDRVVADEFNRRLPAIVTLTIVSSATKAIATYLAQQAVYEQNPDAAWVVAIAGALYQVGTNSADLRIWLTLPKRVLYARLPAPADGVVEVELEGGQRIGPISVESNGASIVHVRVPRAGATPAVHTMRFPSAQGAVASGSRP